MFRRREAPGPAWLQFASGGRRGRKAGSRRRAMQTFKWIALSTPVPGRELELEEWYDNRHIPDCLKLDGFVAAQRFRIDEQPKGIDVPAWKVMVVYDIETHDIETTLAQIPKVVRTPAMPITDAVDMSTALRVLGSTASPRFEKQ